MSNKLINRDKLRLFSQSIGWTFQLSSGLIDVVEGVDFSAELVKGKKFGDFSVTFCELLKPPAAKPSSTLLPKILAERNVNGRYDVLIDRAKRFLYDDYKFCEVEPDTIWVCPKVRLVHDLSKYPELSDIRAAVIDGKYDDEADEEDKEIMRAGLIADGLSPDFIRAQFGF